MSNPLSNRVAAEYTPGMGIHYPETSRRGRAIGPSYANGVAHSVTHLETVTLSLPIGSLGANGSTTLSGKQQLALSSLSLAQSDTARILFTNISATGPANVVIGHPQIVLYSSQGTPLGGVLAAGQYYGNLSMSATVPCISLAGSVAGTVVLTATVLLLGTSTQ